MVDFLRVVRIDLLLETDHAGRVKSKMGHRRIVQIAGRDPGQRVARVVQHQGEMRQKRAAEQAVQRLAAEGVWDALRADLELQAGDFQAVDLQAGDLNDRRHGRHAGQKFPQIQTVLLLLVAQLLGERPRHDAVVGPRVNGEDPRGLVPEAHPDHRRPVVRLNVERPDDGGVGFVRPRHRRKQHRAEAKKPARGDKARAADGA